MPKLTGLLLVASVLAAAVIAVGVWTYWPGRIKHVQEGCPGLVVGQRGVADRSSIVRWDGRTYHQHGDGTERLGAQVTTVACSITDIEGSSGLLAERGPWPDRTASLLPAGTPVYEVAGHDRDCRLGAERGGRLEIYVAWNEATGEPVAGC